MKPVDAKNTAINILKTQDIKKLSYPLWKEQEVKKLLKNQDFVDAFYGDNNVNFRKILNPFVDEKDLPQEKKRYHKIRENRIIYGRLINYAELKNSENYVFCALTKEMIEVDKQYFDSERQISSVLDLLYKPYFFYLTLNQSRNLNFEENVWYEFEIIKENDNDTRVQSSFGCDEGYRREKTHDEHVLNGYLSFSASKTKYESIKTKLKGKAVDLSFPDVTTLYSVNPAIRKDITKPFRKMFYSVAKSNVRVYRVGQANAVSGTNWKNGRTHDFAFDIGFPKSADILLTSKRDAVDKDRSYTWDSDEVSALKPELIMISHWDYDHFMSAVTLDNSVFIGPKPAVWLAPCYEYGRYRDYNIDRLIAFLIRQKLIFFVPNSFKCKTGAYRLCCGIGDLDKGDINSRGLILLLNKTLLTGDCDCQFWPEYITKNATELQYLTVPHHGSKKKFHRAITQIYVDRMFTKKANLEKKAVICVGRNRDGHPDKSVTDFYEKDENFKIVRTDDAKNKSIKIEIIDL